MKTDLFISGKRPLRVWGILRRVRQDLHAQPLQSMLLFAAVASTVALIGMVLLLDRSLTETYTQLMNQAPELVVRRVGPGGWEPMPTLGTVELAGAVPGVLRPRFRIWGVVRLGDAPVTVVGMHKSEADYWPFALPLPETGQALAGPGIALDNGRSGANLITLRGRGTATLKVVERIPRSAAPAVHDVVVVHSTDARRLLGLSKDQASDLALDVFHNDEAEALRPDLARAFPWPVEIVTRQQNMVIGLNDIARRTGRGLLGFLPALLALAWVVAAAGSRTVWQRGETGLLKALGWTGRDILRLHLARSAWLGIPAAATGAAGAYLLLFSPGITWVSWLVLGWDAPAPALYLSATGIFYALGLAVLIVALPFLGAVYWSGWQSAKADPSDLLEAQQG
jgi:hypothetical protein